MKLGIGSNKMLKLKLVPEIQYRNTKIADFILEKRLQSKFTLEQLTQFAGIKDASTLFNYEVGAESIPLNDLYAIANVLNIKPSELLSLMNEF